MGKIVKKFVDTGGLRQYHKKAEQINLDRFVLKEVGKGLSSNDFSNAEKAKLAKLENMDPNGTGMTESQIERLNSSVTKQELEDKHYQDEVSVDNKVNSLRQEIAGKNYQDETAVAAAIANSKHLVRKIVTSKDDIDVNAPNAERTIFLVPYMAEGIWTLYSEWLVINGEKVMVGDGDTELSDYLKKTDLENITDSEIEAIINN